MKKILVVLLFILFLSEGIICQNKESEPDSSLIEEEWLEIYNYLKNQTSSEVDSTDYLYFKIFKGFEIFGSAFRELIKNYVIPLDPESLIEDAIKGITKELDPYTVFYRTEKELNEVVNQRSYVGLGIVTSIVDSSIVVVDFVDSIAMEEKKLKLGDRIIQIDSVRLPPNLDTLRFYTSGEPGSKIKVYIQREGIDTIVIVNTRRREIELPMIELQREIDFKDGKVLYVKINYFSSEMVSEFAKILKGFATQNLERRKGIIIDLRDNPGGTLESGISLCETLLPPGSLIVSLKSNNFYQNKEYRAVFNSIDTATPLIILVNRGSASASEIVAGAVQDNDRGVVLGEATFGKGIVQSIAPLPFDSYLKITTSKYFTPSGRCIHKIRFRSRTSDQLFKTFITDSVFFTKNGRVFKVSDGIQPDILIQKDDSLNFLSHLRNSQIILLYVLRLENTLGLNNPKLKDEKFLLKDFTKFLKEKNFFFKSPAELIVDTLVKDLNKFKEKKWVIEKFEKLAKEIAVPTEKYVLEYRKEVLNLINEEILRRKMNLYDFRFHLLQKDTYYKKALELLENIQEYKNILSPN
ncbi:MAG: S41 family peptidase [Ignavibacteria bacterium]|nr:S41 family peptidase [Ignavibacteria bacterium]